MTTIEKKCDQNVRIWLKSQICFIAIITKTKSPHKVNIRLLVLFIGCRIL